MDKISRAQIAKFDFTNAGAHIEDFVGEGVHITIHGNTGPVNFFLEVDDAIGMFLGLQRSIERLEIEGKETTKNLIADRKAFNKLF